MKMLKRTEIALAVLPKLIGARTPVSAVHLAEQCQISYRRLASVMVKLSNKGIVVGTRGGRGGYMLARPAAKIALVEVFEAMEDRLPADTRLLKQIMAGKGVLSELAA